MIVHFDCIPKACLYLPLSLFYSFTLLLYCHLFLPHFVLISILVLFSSGGSVHIFLLQPSRAAFSHLLTFRMALCSLQRGLFSYSPMDLETGGRAAGQASGRLGNGTNVGVSLSFLFFFDFFHRFLRSSFICAILLPTSLLSLFFGYLEQMGDYSSSRCVFSHPQVLCTTPTCYTLKLSIQNGPDGNRQGVVEEYSQVSEQTSDASFLSTEHGMPDMRSIISIIQRGVFVHDHKPYSAGEPGKLTSILILSLNSYFLQRQWKGRRVF